MTTYWFKKIKWPPTFFNVIKLLLDSTKCFKNVIKCFPMLLNGVSIVLNGHLQMLANIQRAPMHCKWALLRKHDDCSIRLCPIATFSSANFLNLNLVWMQREDRLVSEEELWPSLTHKISLLCSSAVKGRILLMP